MRPQASTLKQMPGESNNGLDGGESKALWSSYQPNVSKSLHLLYQVGSMYDLCSESFSESASGNILHLNPALFRGLNKPMVSSPWS